ncbi:uncharacterized protein LOC102806416 isoform X3 [Saccoglossus kowalevskii]
MVRIRIIDRYKTNIAPRYGRQYDDYQKIIHGVTSERDIKDAIAALQDRFQRLQFMLEDCQDAYRKKHEILQKRNEYMQTSGTINIITTASLILLCLSLISSLVRVALIGNYLSD